MNLVLHCRSDSAVSVAAVASLGLKLRLSLYLTPELTLSPALAGSHCSHWLRL